MVPPSNVISVPLTMGSIKVVSADETSEVLNGPVSVRLPSRFNRPPVRVNAVPLGLTITAFPLFPDKVGKMSKAALIAANSARIGDEFPGVLVPGLPDGL